MPTLSQEVTSTPVDVAAALDLDRGRWYLVQNVAGEPVRFAQQPTAPADPATAAGFAILPNASFEIRVQGTEKWWFWCRAGTATIVLDLRG